MNDYRIPQRMSTKDYIALTFWEMLKTKPFDSIFVSEIVEACGVSRTSFYRHFADKYDVLIWIYKMQLDQFDMENLCFTQRQLAVLELMYDNRKYFKNVLTNDRENALKNHIFQRGCAYLSQHMKNELGIEELPDDIIASIEFFNAGANHMWLTWINNGMKESPELMKKRIFENMPEVIRTHCS